MGIDGGRMDKLKGIKVRLVGSYLLVIFLTVSILIGFLILAAKQYYHQNVEEIITQQAEVSALFYNRYLAKENLEEQAPELLRSFSMNTPAQVQIISSKGQLLQDSMGTNRKGTVINTSDVQSSLRGKIGEWRGSIPETGEPALSVAYPLRFNDQVVGVARFITSLTETNSVIQTITYVLISIGFAAVAIAAIVSLLLSNTITNPVKEITQVAGIMAAGNFSVRAKKRYDDEIGKLVDTLNYMASELTRSEQLKNEFIASVSHELRTPLTSIKGWAMTLRTGDLKNKQEVIDGLHIIENETDRLTVLVEELLDFSKFEAGRITLNLQNLNIKHLLEYMEKQMSPRALRQGIKFDISYADHLPTIKADENRLKQVLINVLDNALKFTPHGGSIHVESYTRQNHVGIIIRDTGQGIPTEDLPYVKQKFYKGRSKRAGSGIGLAISTEIIRLHQGQLHIKSVPGEGTIVEIILPL
jgi:signal transduction histidine kinase